MKKLSLTDTSVAKDATPALPRIKVCMHKMGAARTDNRIMYDATALVEAGFAVTIIDVEHEHTRLVEEDIRGVCMKHIIIPGWLISKYSGPWYPIKMALMIIVSTFRLLQTEADIYHAHVEKAFPACYLAARLRRKPLILDTPELSLSDPVIRQRSMFRTLSIHLLRHIVRHCAGYITGSPLYPQEIHDLYHASKVTVIRHVPAYRSVSKVDRLQQRLGLSPDTRIALYQGGLQRNRSLDRLVRAAPFLDPGITIVLMGQDIESIRFQLDSLIASEGVDDRVKIIPAVPYEELLDWTASADIGLTIFDPDYSLSIRKCLPNKVFEYLMAGLPVLTSQLDAIMEVIKAYDVGQIVSSLAPADIGSAINTMLADRLALGRMRRNALDAAQHEFYWEKESKRLVRLYHEILGIKADSNESDQY